MIKIDYLEYVLENLIDANNKASNLSLDNVHHKGLFSLVIKGDEFGKLLRVFITFGKIKPFAIQLHTHRYPILLTPVKGSITQHTATVSDTGITMSKYDYKSVLNGGNGLQYEEDVNIKLDNFFLPVGCSVKMDTEEFHTISCSKDSIWIVEEFGFEKDSSKLLGVPFSVDSMYEKPSDSTITMYSNLVRAEIRNLIKLYKK